MAIAGGGAQKGQKVGYNRSMATAPADLSAEESVLGSVLLESVSLVKVADFLAEDDFFVEGNARIFGAMLELFRKHAPVDLVTLRGMLADRGQLDGIGGAARLAELSSTVPSATHIFEYATRVKQKSTLRRMIAAGGEVMRLGQDEEKPVEELLETAEKQIFGISQTFLRNRFIPLKEILSERFEVFAERFANESDEPEGIPTGFSGLDRLLGGLNGGDMLVLAARPSMGKTALALSVSLHAALQKQKRVGVFSLEMSREQLVDRLFAAQLGVDSYKLQKGKLSETDFGRMGQVMDELSAAPLYIDDTSGSSMAEIRAKSRRLQMEHGLDMLVIDYLQLISSGNAAYAGNRVQEISEISRQFKALARELRVPILALSQLSRAVEQRPSKIPILSDLRESGAIEQDADVVLMMYREDYYDDDVEPEKRGLVDVFVRKHRNGPTGMTQLRFDAPKMRFTQVDHRVSEMD